MAFGYDLLFVGKSKEIGSLCMVSALALMSVGKFCGNRLTIYGVCFGSLLVGWFCEIRYTIYDY